MIAPFWADVDTRTGPVVTYGYGTVDGHTAFGVNWLGVGCYNENTSVANYFQVLLINRSDVGPNDFDIEFNYGPITWDSGQASGGNGQCLGGTAARAGYTSGFDKSSEFKRVNWVKHPQYEQLSSRPVCVRYSRSRQPCSGHLRRPGRFLFFG
jgi:hypothetical protein